MLRARLMIPGALSVILRVCHWSRGRGARASWRGTAARPTKEFIRKAYPELVSAGAAAKRPR
jgi:hypothetical protein